MAVPRVVGATYLELCAFCEARGLRPALAVNVGFDGCELSWLSARWGRNVLVAVPIGVNSLDEASAKALGVLRQFDDNGEL